MANKKKKSKFSLRKLIYNDKYLIIISIVLSLVVWIATSINLSPETTKTITVPVTVDFSGSAAEQLGLKCFGDESIDVDVTVSCKKYLAMEVSADNINISLDTNAVTNSGYTDVPIKVDTNNNSDFKVTSYYPTVYRAYFDIEQEKTMDIDIRYTNEDFIADGYMMGEPLLSESTVTVRGPRTYVSQVESVVSNVNIEKELNQTTSMDLSLTAVDSYGSRVSYITIDTGGESLTITIPVLKEMTLDVSASFTGKPSRVSTADFDVAYSVKRVSAGVLEDADIKVANIGTIDFSQLNVGENKFTFNVDSMKGIVVLDNIDTITATITVPSDYVSTTVNVNTSNGSVINVPDGYKATVTSISSNQVTVIGKEENVENLTSSNIKLVVDLSKIDSKEIKTGLTTFDAATAVEKSDTCWVYGKYKVTVNITKA